jgi:hypothetical protein
VVKWWIAGTVPTQMDRRGPVDGDAIEDMIQHKALNGFRIRLDPAIWFRVEAVIRHRSVAGAGTRATASERVD